MVAPRDKGWDWSFILYAGMNWLGYSETEVWQLTPRKLFCLLDTHQELFRKKWGIKDPKTSNEPTGFIDQIGW